MAKAKKNIGGAAIMLIESFRAEIDTLDAELLELLNRRARVALQVGRTKIDAGLPVCDAERERQVVARACNQNSGPLCNDAVARIFRRIIVETRRAELHVHEAEQPSTEKLTA
jgi:chorismate mutase / prephenate dehydratase